MEGLSMLQLSAAAAALSTTPPTTLALLVALAAIGLAAFALYVTHALLRDRGRD
jgi:hypothetical protein